jgi:hypothetical protein
MYLSRNTETLLRNHCCSGKAVSIKYHDCVSLFLPLLSGMQIATLLRQLSYVACLAVPNFSALSHKQHDFRKKIYILNIKCVF